MSLDAPLSTVPDSCAAFTVYRFYNSLGRLLYVGASEHGPGRWAKHRNGKPWWTEVTRVDVVHYQTKAETFSAEAYAIRHERPFYNVQHNGAPPDPSHADLLGMTVRDFDAAIAEREAYVDLLNAHLEVWQAERARREVLR